MGERRGDVDDVVAAEAEVVDVVIGGARQRVVAVQRALGLARGARGEQQLGDLRPGRGLASGDRAVAGEARRRRSTTTCSSAGNSARSPSAIAA